MPAMVMHTAIRSQTHAVMKACGLYLPPATWRASIGTTIAATQDIWNGIRNPIFGRELTCAYNDLLRSRYPRVPGYIAEFPLLFAFGYDLATRMCDILGDDPGRRHSAGVLGGLFNGFVCLFDMVCDQGRPELYDRLVAIISAEAVANCLRPETGSSPPRTLDAATTDDLSIRMIVALWNGYIHRVRMAHSRLDRVLWQGFRDAVRICYDAEIASRTEVSLTRPARGATHDILFNKGALLVWILCLNAAMGLDRGRRVDPMALKAAMSDLGTAIWLADDLADVTDDLASGIWNVALMRLADEHGITPYDSLQRPREPDDIVAQLLSTGTIESVARDMCDSYRRAMSAVSNLAPSRDGFDAALLPWLNSWIA